MNITELLYHHGTKRISHVRFHTTAFDAQHLNNSTESLFYQSISWLTQNQPEAHARDVPRRNEHGAQPAL